MKLLSSGRWRSVRWLLLLVCLSGGLLAAESNWVTTLRVGQSLTNWLARLTSDEPTGQIALPLEVAPTPQTNYTTNPWLNTALFTPPSNGWTLYSSRLSSGSMIATQQVSTTMVPSALPTASFSSGFVSYTPTFAYGPVPLATTASGVWSLDGSNNWSNPASWQGGVVADGAGNSASFNALNITGDVTVTLDTSRTIGQVFLGDTNGTHRYLLNASGGSSLTFDSAVQFTSAILQQTATSAGDTVSVPILMNSDLDINNLSTTNVFTVSGSIAGNTGPSSFIFLQFNTHDQVDPAGDIHVSGNISNGTATSLGVSVFRGGTVTFSGTNTYTGSTSVNDGTLLINGNNGGAPGSVFVGGGGTLGGTGTVGGTVFTFGGTITGATEGTVGTLTLTSNVNLSTGEGSGTYWADLSGSTSDLLAITGNLNLGEGSILDIHGVGDGVTTYTLATFATRDDVFETVMGIPGGYALVYHDMDIQLVPIPEPATWIGGTLALGVIAFAMRRRSKALKS